VFIGASDRHAREPASLHAWRLGVAKRHLRLVQLQHRARRVVTLVGRVYSAERRRADVGQLAVVLDAFLFAEEIVLQFLPVGDDAQNGGDHDNCAGYPKDRDYDRLWNYVDDVRESMSANPNHDVDTKENVVNSVEDDADGPRVDQVLAIVFVIDSNEKNNAQDERANVGEQLNVDYW